jgi:very-short-patch-repair endonuclease
MVEHCSGEMAVSRRSTTKARSFRRVETRAEAAMWALLRAGRFRGLKFRRQHPIDRYFADFACVQARLVVEVDGGVHRTDEQVLRDLERTRVIEANGWHVLRLSNDQVLHRPEEALAAIGRLCEIGGVV